MTNYMIIYGEEIENLNKEIKFYQAAIIRDCSQIIEVWGDRGHLMKGNISSMQMGLDKINQLEREIKAIKNSLETR